MKSYLHCLDSIHHLGLRLVLAALRISPIRESRLGHRRTCHFSDIQNFNLANPTMPLNAILLL